MGTRKLILYETIVLNVLNLITLTIHHQWRLYTNFIGHLFPLSYRVVAHARPLWSQGGDQLPGIFEYFSRTVKMDPASGCPKISIKPVLSREQLSADFILLGEKWKLLQSGTCNMQNEQERIGGEMMKSIGKKKRSMKEKQQQRALWILYRRKPCTDKENSVYRV